MCENSTLYLTLILYMGKAAKAVTFMENLSAMSLFALIHLTGLLLILCSSQMHFQHTPDHYRNFLQLLQQVFKNFSLELNILLKSPHGKN